MKILTYPTQRSWVRLFKPIEDIHLSRASTKFSLRYGRKWLNDMLSFCSFIELEDFESNLLGIMVVSSCFKISSREGERKIPLSKLSV